MVIRSNAHLMADRKCVSPPHFAISKSGDECVGLQRVYPFCGRYQVHGVPYQCVKCTGDEFTMNGAQKLGKQMLIVDSRSSFTLILLKDTRG